MADAPRQTVTINVLVSLAALVIILAGMRAASAIVVPFLLAAFIALIAAAPMGWLMKKGLQQWLALVVVIVMLLLIGGVLIGLAGTSATQFTARLPQYQQALDSRSAATWTWLAAHGLDLSELSLRELFDPGATMGFVAGALNEMRKWLTNGLLIFLTVVFMLMEAAVLPSKLRALASDPKFSQHRIHQFVNAVRHYLAIKAAVSLFTGFLVTILTAAFGLDFPILWGLVAFVLNFVPTIGSVIAAIPAVLLAVIQLGALPALGVAGGYLAINFLIGNGIEPRLMGRQLGLSTLVVFLSLLFWGWIFGPVGMLLSVPLTISAKFALESREDTARYAVLLAGEAPPEPEPASEGS